jgi:O-antigen ligase
VAARLAASGRVSPAIVAATGAASAGMLAIWTLASARVAGGDPWPLVGLLALAAATFLVAWGASRRRQRIVPGAVIAVSIVVSVLAALGLAGTVRLLDLASYPNAQAELFVQATIAGGMLGAMPGSWRGRVAGNVAALGFACGVLLTRSSGGIVLLCAVGLTALWARRRPTGGSGIVAVAWGIALAIAFAATVVLGLGSAPGSPGALERSSSDPLSLRRLELWHEAITLMDRAPVWGVGPGRFADVRGVARTDTDIRWAHEEFLQRGAETGVAGLILTGSVFVWAIVAIVVGGRRGLVPALGITAVAALGIHACIDYVLHYPLIVMAAAALAGVAAARPRIETPGG